MTGQIAADNKAVLGGMKMIIVLNGQTILRIGICDEGSIVKEMADDMIDRKREGNGQRGREGVCNPSVTWK